VVDGRDIEFANIMVHSEGVSAANSFIIRKEILQSQENNTGPEIYFPGEKYNGTPGVLAGLTSIDNSTATWTAPDRLQVFSEVGANYLANVLTSGGTPPSTLTNWQANVDSSRAVRGLPAAPAPQPNSVELLDVNNDGVIEMVKYRDFSNTCRREDYTVSPVGLPSTASYTFRAGFDSELANKEVVSTAGDGLVSKVRFEFDAQSHITVANSVLAVNADLSGRTTTVQQINSTWVQDAWHYSATGVATGHELATLRANLSVANITAYNALGQADVATTFALDGSSVVYDYDLTESLSWHTQVTAYDTVHAIDTVTYYNRNATINAYDYDNGNTHADWDWFAVTYDDKSRADTTIYHYENGRQLWIDLDQDQNQGTAANRGAGVGKSCAASAQNRGTSEQLSLYIQ
jgi:hypothetical protein